MSLCLIENGLKSINSTSTDGYKESILDFQYKVKNLRLGYVPGLIRHYYHGSKINRKYVERWQILVKHNYDPYTFLDKNEDGILVPNNNFPKELLDDIYNYFAERNEDEEFFEKK